MLRLLWVLFLCAGFVTAQEREDEGISIDETPSGPETEPEKAEKPDTARPAREPGKKVPTVALKKKVFSLSVPADWVLQEYDDPKAELAWEVLLPGSEKRATLAISRAERTDARSWPYYQAEWIRKERPEETVEVRKKPLPRVVVQRADERIDAFFALSVRNNVFLLQIFCAKDDFPQAETDMFEIARSFAADVEIYPPIPKGYETSEQGPWLIARAPNVTASLTPLVKTLKAQEKRFRKEHGALPKSDAPLVVLVHASRSDAGKIEPRVIEGEWEMVSDDWGRRLFAIPFEKDNLELESQLASVAQGLLFIAKYGDTRPEWISDGESTIARAEVHTGKSLPYLHEGFVGWASTLKLHRPDELEELRSSDVQSWGKEAFFQVAALREGKYKKQYKAFLEDFAETNDGLGAYARHLGTIDPDDLKSATDHYMQRIKPVKPK